MIKRFGQKAILQVYAPNGDIIFSSEGLRVDFDIRLIQEFNRAKFSIYNLSNNTIKEISKGERYVRLFTSLHDQPLELLANDFYVNNAYTEKLVPNTITSLFCVDKLRKDFTSKQLRILVKKPTLNNTLQSIIRQSVLKGVEFLKTDIPDEVLNYVPLKAKTSYSGETNDIIKELGKEYSFTHNIKGSSIDLMYQPLYANKSLSGQSTRSTIVLETSNMKSNPIVGVAKLQVDSNIDNRIQCNTLLDVTNLITATSEHGFEALTINKNFLENSVTGWSKYLTLSVQHIGSTHTRVWSTKAIALTATKGTKMDTFNWYGGN